MKTFTFILDMLIVCLLVLAVQFSLSDDSIVNSHVTRSGIVRTLIISWQTLIGFAAFCFFLRYIVQQVAYHEA